MGICNKSKTSTELNSELGWSQSENWCIHINTTLRLLVPGPHFRSSERLHKYSEKMKNSRFAIPENNDDDEDAVVDESNSGDESHNDDSEETGEIGANFSNNRSVDSALYHFQVTLKNPKLTTLRGVARFNNKNKAVPIFIHWKLFKFVTTYVDSTRRHRCTECPRSPGSYCSHVNGIRKAAAVGIEVEDEEGPTQSSKRQTFSIQSRETYPCE